MSQMRLRPIEAMLATAFLGLVIAAPVPAPAMESTPPTVTPPSSSTQQGTTSGKKKKTKATSGHRQQRSDREFNDGFWAAYNLIYKDHDYAAGIAKLRTLGHDDMAAIANLIGYASRKLGRYDDAKYW